MQAEEWTPDDARTFVLDVLTLAGIQLTDDEQTRVEIAAETLLDN